MSTFQDFLVEFKNSAHYTEMAGTVEDSPWHREANVWVHTEMVLDAYALNFAPHRTDLANLIAQVALLFHDAGKPSAEEVLEKKDGEGVYRRYAGHEQHSAISFMDYYLKSAALQSLLSPDGARAVRWIIEHHLPYGFKDTAKRKGLGHGTLAALHGAGITIQTFFDCLRADAAGRTSDDHPQKLSAVEVWINDFKPLCIVSTPIAAPQKLYIMIGPSGSGKTTWTAARLGFTDRVVSLDDMRIDFLDQHEQFFDSDVKKYARAWEFATSNEAAFSKYVREQTKKIFSDLPAGASIFIDATNLSRKRRAQWVELGRQKKMEIIGVEFWNTFETLLDRQGTRGDKYVPYAAVKSQHAATALAWVGHEVSSVITIIGQ